LVMGWWCRVSDSEGNRAEYENGRKGSGSLLAAGPCSFSASAGTKTQTAVSVDCGLWTAIKSNCVDRLSGTNLTRTH